MAKYQTRYICQSCGFESLQWMGKCQECDQWDSLVEEVQLVAKAGKAVSSPSPLLYTTEPISIVDVQNVEMDRLSSGIGELDRVLGGGFVPGSLVLVGGDPGIGKSTLLTQTASNVAKQAGGNVLYLSGEESAQQIKLRSGRIGAEQAGFLISTENEVGAMIQQLQKIKPLLAIVDSIQTISDGGMESAPGSVSQVRQCASLLSRYAKASGTPIVLIGHVTKEGSLAGPRVLEHLVDAVITFEGDRYQSYRLLRATKNRFGSTDELGIFEMCEAGLIGVENPSALLLSERDSAQSGSSVTSILEGSRALLVEVQGLCTRSYLERPRRAVQGIDARRADMILAVLEKRLGLKMAEQDAFVNVAGGMRIAEPAADLAIAMAVVSSFRDQPLRRALLLVGELGLGGEIRAVAQTEKRLREAARQGFKEAVVASHFSSKLSPDLGLKILPASNILEVVQSSLVPIR